jgi:hypothetical protein
MQFHKIIGIKECPLRADTAQEHSDPGMRLGDGTVMLRATKHLEAQRERPFAAAQGDTVRHLRLTPIGRNSLRPGGNWLPRRAQFIAPLQICIVFPLEGRRTFNHCSLTTGFRQSSDEYCCRRLAP